MSRKYLAYDIKGIQSFIYSVPKLRYIVGASALIDQFDRQTARRLVKGLDDVTYIFSGGGRGAYFSGSEEGITALRDRLLDEARGMGLDIRLGEGSDYSFASRHADELFPYVPPDLEGPPCSVSGLFPTPGDGSRPHRMIELRRKQGDAVGEKLLGELNAELRAQLGNLTGADLEAAERILVYEKWALPRNVDEDANTDEGTETDEASNDRRAQSSALCARNRWAVLAMDGNDIGRQHTVMWSREPDEKSHLTWVRTMSEQLDACTRGAFVEAMRGVVLQWAQDPEAVESAAYQGKLYLPFRPLIVGGDDVLTLLNPGYAMEFASALAKSLEKKSQESAAYANEEQGIEELWPATGNRLTISAGTLFCKKTYPLHAAIAYAEQLLESAKAAHRSDGTTPSPAAVDWEHVTDGLLDSPEARRRRTLEFFDKDIQEDVRLTARPCTFADLGDVLEHVASSVQGAVSRSIQQAIIPGLRQGFYDRVAWRLSIGRNHRWLADLLEEGPEQVPKDGGWSREERKGRRPLRWTMVPDALLLLEERHRLEATENAPRKEAAG